MYKTDVNSEMISLMRGFFTMPVLSGLGKIGVLDEMKSSEGFSADNFENIENKKVLNDSFKYLSRLGLLEEVGNKYKATDLGREVFQRHSSFYVPHSYHHYMSAYSRLLVDPTINLKEEVDRLENVVGSGNTHQRYFFPAVSFLKRKAEFDLIADLGCGNGFFLREVLKSVADKDVVGIDLSPVAIEETHKNLQADFPERDIQMICSDAADIDNWAGQLLKIAGKRKVALSMWFLIHEISKHNSDVVIKFLNNVYQKFPKAPIVVGELVRHPNDVLSEQRGTSIMPEYLFFHDLSGQGILSWEEYQNILDNIPYKVSSQRTFDELSDKDGNNTPSAFVWCLIPK